MIHFELKNIILLQNLQSIDYQKIVHQLISFFLIQLLIQKKLIDRFLKIWDSLEPGEWKNYDYLPNHPSDVKVMKPVFDIMQEFIGRSNVDMINSVKKYFEGLKNGK